MRALVPVAVLLAIALPAAAREEWRGRLAAEFWGFAHSGLDPVQHRGDASLAVQPEYLARSRDGHQSLTFAGFYRWDQRDRQRTHGDLRELLWLYAGQGYELRAGIGKVFWGVTETQHLVDVVNQIDLVENPDRKERLGQPMLGATLLTGSGNLEFYLLPYFRERTFPGAEGRLRSVPRVDTGQAARYESPRGARHLDAAARWTRTLGAWDLGLSYFRGTDREPRLAPGLDAGGQPVLVPDYRQLRQLGVETQATLERWQWKLEAVRRAERGASSHAATAGFEITLPGLLGGPSDLGLLAEYLYDSRGRAAFTPYQDDAMLGLRWTANDGPGTQLLATIVIDRRSSERAFSLEASRRLGANLAASLEARAFSARAPDEFLYSLRRDDTAQLKLTYYF
ncbi:MAG: hypothetical protein OEW21_02845 [Betaproteobacteria bacterium]|nr:hypothetical protein [Betaproteobacteria bacterium]